MQIEDFSPCFDGFPRLTLLIVGDSFSGILKSAIAVGENGGIGIFHADQ